MAEYQPAQLERLQKPAIQHEPQARRAPEPAPHPLVSLQARAGNQAIARMVQRAAEEEELQAKHDPLQRTEEEEPLQAKHDPLQRAAEEEELQAKHDPLQRAEEEELQAKHDPLQRAEEEEELQAKHDPLQRAGEEEELQMKHDTAPRVGLEGGPVGAEIESQVNSLRGQGSGVPESIRTQMEAATGTDLGGVRVHEGREADTLNRQLTAKAFTTGSDIFLRSDASAGDGQLMAHELAHVVQQSSGRTASGGSGMTAGAANDPLESEADSLAHAVLSGTAQRHPEEAQA